MTKLWRRFFTSDGSAANSPPFVPPNPRRTEYKFPDLKPYPPIGFPKPPDPVAIREENFAKVTATLIDEACQKGHLAMMEFLLEKAAEISDKAVREVLKKGIHDAIDSNAAPIAALLLERGADVTQYGGHDLGRQPSREMIEVLLTHGWNIDNRGRYGWPLIMLVLEDPEMVTWCLDHGASVTLQREAPEGETFVLKRHARVPTILEYAARRSTVSTFKQLRALGSPLGPRTLHFAVLEAGQAKRNTNPSTSEPVHHDKPQLLADTYAERMALVRYLVDDLGLDINAHVPNRRSIHEGTPLEYIAQSEYLTPEPRELMYFLLDRGAVPTDGAIEAARLCQNPFFERIVEDWKAMQPKVEQPELVPPKPAMHARALSAARRMLTRKKRSDAT